MRLWLCNSEVEVEILFQSRNQLRPPTSEEIVFLYARSRKLMGYQSKKTSKLQFGRRNLVELSPGFGFLPPKVRSSEVAVEVALHHFRRSSSSLIVALSSLIKP
jgi:hypothetical protein